METRTTRYHSSNRGSTLLLAMLILGALSILGATVAVVSMGDRNLSRYERPVSYTHLTLPTN